MLPVVCLRALLKVSDMQQKQEQKMIGWIRSWWITWRVWRNADAEQRAIMTGPHNPDDYVDAPRPV